MKTNLMLVFFAVSFGTMAQVNDSITKFQDLAEVYTDRNFANRYNKEVKRVRKIYPLALHAADLVDELEEQLTDVKSKRKQKKLGKETHNALKSDFNYTVKDLYTSEGILLMKLIQRETGMTVSEIISKYRSKLRSNVYESMGKIWDQDLNVKYDPKGKDWLTEMVIQDIMKGEVKFEKVLKPVTKDDYKKSQKQYRIDKNAAKKSARASRRAGKS
jgi:hypothetical protein